MHSQLDWLSGRTVGRHLNVELLLFSCETRLCESSQSVDLNFFDRPKVTVAVAGKSDRRRHRELAVGLSKAHGRRNIAIWMAENPKQTGGPGCCL